MRYIVRLNDDTVGEIKTDKNLSERIGKNVNVLLHDENGAEIIKAGELAEIIEENEL